MKNENLKQNRDVKLELIDYSENINLDDVFNRNGVEVSVIFENLKDNPKVNIYLEFNISDELLLRKIVTCKITDFDKFLESSLSKGYLSISDVIKLLDELRDKLYAFPSEVTNMEKYLKEKNLLSLEDVSENAHRIRDYINSERYSSHISLIQTLINKYKEMK